MTKQEKNILLVEPAYKTKYPPLGLMKLSTYHKRRGDYIEFVKGTSGKHANKIWDRIYISTLFTYNWDVSLKTIKYYQKSVRNIKDIYVGGVTATILKDDLIKETGVSVISGLLDKPGILDKNCNIVIDTLIPDYDILQKSDFCYDLLDSYIGYATRGCSRKCKFCAVHIIEPKFSPYLPLKRQVQLIEDLYGRKKNLVLLDNNVLASESFEKIISDIKDLGFERGAKFQFTNKAGLRSYSNRVVDFNQGLDSRLLTDKKMALLSEIAIKPIRIAFDDIRLRTIYEDKIRLAAKYSLRYLSNYILYNYEDHPDDFYKRLKINVELNSELNLQIFSFPMRYVPLNSKSRNLDYSQNIGRFWNRKYLRAIQCILIRTHGLVGPKEDYFLEAFGKNLKEFHKILLMPEDYIINRMEHRKVGNADKWWEDYSNLPTSEKKVFHGVILNHDFKKVDLTFYSKKLRKALGHYFNKL